MFPKSCPLKSRAGEIRKWIDEEARADIRGQRGSAASVFVGTVHSFQGGQSDVVIFDLVDGFPRNGPGALLRGDSAMRLANVALTRARGKLILIINQKWIRERCGREQLGLLWDLVCGQANRTSLIEVHPPFRPERIRNNTSEPQPESPIEELFLTELNARRADLPSFQLQVPIFNGNGRIVSRADFAFVEQKVAVYCDGARFHLVQERWHRDLRQRRELMKLGWSPLVFSGREIHANVKSKVQELVEYLTDC